MTIYLRNAMNCIDYLSNDALNLIFPKRGTIDDFFSNSQLISLSAHFLKLKKNGHFIEVE